MNSQPRIKKEEIRLSADGVWYHGDTEVTHERTVEMFFKNIYEQGGHYFLKGEAQPVPVNVDDVAFFVKSIDLSDDQFIIRLSDGSTEILDITSLDVGKNNQLYCRVKNSRTPAKFERSVYHGMMNFFAERDGYYGLVLDGVFYPVRPVQEIKVNEEKPSAAGKATVNSVLKLVTKSKTAKAKPVKKALKSKNKKEKKKVQKKMVVKTKAKVVKKKKPILKKNKSVSKKVAVKKAAKKKVKHVVKKKKTRR